MRSVRAQREFRASVFFYIFFTFLFTCKEMTICLRKVGGWSLFINGVGQAWDKMYFSEYAFAEKYR